jgi:hypothetical protein
MSSWRGFRWWLSLTIGFPGFHVNIPLTTRRPSTYSVNLPGTGLSYRDRLPLAPKR